MPSLRHVTLSELGGPLQGDGPPEDEKRNTKNERGKTKEKRKDKR
jgi:hypothetical protein